jgi:hypothetical protein
VFGCSGLNIFLRISTTCTCSSSACCYWPPRLQTIPTIPALLSVFLCSGPSSFVLAFMPLQTSCPRQQCFLFSMHTVLHSTEVTPILCIGTSSSGAYVHAAFACRKSNWQFPQFSYSPVRNSAERFFTYFYPTFQAALEPQATSSWLTAPVNAFQMLFVN